MQEAESGAKLVDSTVPGAAAVNQKGKWDYLIGVALACFIGLLNGSLSGDASSRARQEPVLAQSQLPLCQEPSVACGAASSPHVLLFIMSAGTEEACLRAVPFKYAQKEVKGIVYILSFGIGVAIVSSARANRHDNICILPS